MSYTVVIGESANDIYNFALYLVETSAIAYQSFLFPYVDAIIMKNEKKKDFYFNDRLILNNDFLSFEELKTLSLSHSDKLNLYECEKITENEFLSKTHENDRFEISRFRTFDYPFQLRAYSRKGCSFAEISERVLKKYNSKLLSYNGFEIEYEKSPENAEIIRNKLTECRNHTFS